MNERRACPHHRHPHALQTFEDEPKRKTETGYSRRHELASPDAAVEASRPTAEQPVVRTASQRPTAVASASWNLLTKDREIAKLKALLFQKDDELIELTVSHKNALRQMEERMERERKVWTEHKDLLLAGERAKLDEEKTRLHKGLQDQLKLEQERCQRLEQKLHAVQMQASEVQLALKESGRERINAVYAIKEQCRKEFLEEICRLRNQLQQEKDKEFARLQERIHELEATLLTLSNSNVELNTRMQATMVALETSEKACVRSLHDCMKKLLMAMDSPSSAYNALPSVTTFTYDHESLTERLPTRHILKLLQNQIDDLRKYLTERNVRLPMMSKSPEKSTTLVDRSSECSNRASGEPVNARGHHSASSWSRTQKENEYNSVEAHRLSPTEDSHSRSPLKSPRAFHLTSQQNDTIDNLVQKLENHIAFELDRLTKQRLTVSGSHDFDLPSTTFHSKQPKKLKSDLDTTSKLHSDIHSYLSRDHRRFRVKFSSPLESPKPPSYSPMHSHKHSSAE